MKKLLPNTEGLAHYFLIALVAASVAIGGTYYLVRSYADTCSGSSAASCATAKSFTWAGYQAAVSEASGKHFNAASGDFTVPTITCDAKDKLEAYESFSQWVGIDGVSNENLVQTGIEVHCVAAANNTYKAVYFPWWEVIQGGKDTWRGKQFAVRSGDVMSARVTFAKNKYTISLQNKTTGKGFNEVKTCVVNGAQCVRSSAEWVIERPGGANANGYGGVLANFGSTSFRNVSTQRSDKSSTLNLKQAGAQAVTMADNQATLTRVTATSKGNDSFTITYFNHGTTTATTPH